MELSLHNNTFFVAVMKTNAGSLIHPGGRPVTTVSCCKLNILILKRAPPANTIGWLSGTVAVCTLLNVSNENDLGENGG